MFWYEEKRVKKIFSNLFTILYTYADLSLTKCSYFIQCMSWEASPGGETELNTQMLKAGTVYNTDDKN